MSIDTSTPLGNHRGVVYPVSLCPISNSATKTSHGYTVDTSPNSSRKVGKFGYISTRDRVHIAVLHGKQDFPGEGEGLGLGERYFCRSSAVRRWC